MNKEGYLPEHNCKQCNNPLSKTERYLGIYTGLCNHCMNMSAYIVAVYKIDNCLIVSHPPNSPSHRRDRSEHHAYIDCSICKGTGHIYVSRSFTVGGSYYRYCRDCLDRYYNQSMRKADEADRKEIEETRIQPYKLALDKQFRKVVPAELKEKPYSKYTEEDKIEWTGLAEVFLIQFDTFRKRATKICDIMYGKAYLKREYKPGAIPLLDT